MDIGKRVRAAREARKLTQEQLARRADVPLNRVGRIETGVVADPHYSSLSKIAGGLGLTVAELVGEPIPAGKDEAPPPGQPEKEQLDANELAAVYGDLSSEIERVSKAPAEDLKAERIAELRKVQSEALTALTRALNGQSWSLSELSLQAVLRQRRRKTQQGTEDAGTEAG